MVAMTKRTVSCIILLTILVTIAGGCVKKSENTDIDEGVVSECYSIPNVQQKNDLDSGRSFHFTKKTSIAVTSEELEDIAGVFAEDLKDITGYSIKVKKDGKSGGGDILLEIDHGFDIDPEGYTLEVREDKVTIKGKTREGVFYGTRTLLQWLKQGTLIPETDVTDYPAYRERSSLIDVARKYFSIEYIKNHIREMSYLKYNYLYLHLTDNEGFRLECESYPEIVADKHYPKNEIKDIVEFAARYNIVVVPEIEMPGHMGGVIKVHRDWELADKNGNKNGTRLDITKDEVYTFVESIIDEYAPYFPGKYFHIGADEYIPLNEYVNYPALQEYAKQKYGDKAKAVDVYYGFVNHVNEIVKRNGKITRMWNDGLGPNGTVDVSNDIVVDVWNTGSGSYTAKQLIKKGYTVGNSNTSKLYYVLGVDWASADAAVIYETFEPYIFVNNEMLEDEPKNLGAKFQLWCDNADAETEEELYSSLECIYRALAQKNWGSEKRVSSYDDFKVIMNKVGSAPGYTHKEINLKLYDRIEQIEITFGENYEDINLGQIYSVHEIELTRGEDTEKVQEIYLSIDGINFSKEAQKGQFVRVNREGINNTYTIDVYGKLLPDNIALNKEVKVSTQYDKKIWPASYTVDGSLSTRWASFDTAHSKGTEWLMTDLGEVFEITGTAVYWEVASAKSYYIEISEDGDNWTKVFETKEGDGGTDVLSVKGKGRYVRITANAFNTPYGISIFEFKVFGYK